MKDKMVGSELLSTQYQTVKTKTSKSHVLQWGDLKIDTEVIGAFEAAKYQSPKDKWTAFKTFGKSLLKDSVGWEDAETAKLNDFAVDVRDIDMHYLYTKVTQDPSE